MYVLLLCVYIISLLRIGFCMLRTYVFVLCIFVFENYKLPALRLFSAVNGFFVIVFVGVVAVIIVVFVAVIASVTSSVNANKYIVLQRILSVSQPFCSSASLPRSL